MTVAVVGDGAVGLSAVLAAETEWGALVTDEEYRGDQAERSR